MRSKIARALIRLSLFITGSYEFSRNVRVIDKDHHYSVWSNTDVVVQVPDMRTTVTKEQIRECLVDTLASFTPEINEQFRTTAYNHGLLTEENYPV